MKLFAGLLLIAEIFTPAATLADYQPGYSRQCFLSQYREEYIPGTQSRPGRVKRWNEQVEAPCGVSGAAVSRVDENSCVEGSLLGGLLGGALGGTLATQENWIWSIPSGIAAGAVIGCEADGG
jgi:hypothetical protein